MADFNPDPMPLAHNGPVEIDADEANQVQSAMNSGGLEAVREYLETKLNEWRSIPLNVGLIGITGSGKSSFINAIRGMIAEDAGAAKVGVVEGTTEPTPYAHPNNPLLIFWDLPGVGTANFPQETYLNDIGFGGYDFFFIVTSTRFTESDLWLSRQIKEHGKKFFFIRTKISFDISNDAYNYPNTHNPENLLETIRQNIEKHLGELYTAENVFLLDNHHRKKFQFEALEQKLIDDFPKMKRQALILSMTAISGSVIRSKVKELRSSIWKTACLSAAIAVVPMPLLSIGADITMISAHIAYFSHQLGIDEKSLMKTARLMKMDPERLKIVVDENNIVSNLLTLNGLTELLPKFTTATIVEETSRFIPIVGSWISATVSFGTTYLILDYILTHMEQVAIDVVNIATQQVAAEAVLGDN